MKNKSFLATTVAFIVSVATINASAQGLFSGLANRQDDIKKAESEFKTIFKSYKPFLLLKGEMGRKDDGTPDIAIGGDGDVQVVVKIDIDQAEYDEWLTNATNTFAKYADRVLPPTERPTSEDSGKPKIRVGETTYIFAKDMESAIDSAKKSRVPQKPCVAVFLVDIDGNVVAEPESKRMDRGTTIEEDIKLYTSNKTLQGGGDLTVSQVLTWLFCGGDYSDLGMAWMGEWENVAIKVTGRRPNQFLDVSFYDRHRLTTESFPDNGPLEQLSSWNAAFGYKGAKAKTISFGKLPKEKLEAVQGVRVCVGGIQYKDFLNEIKSRSEKEAAERRALEED